MHGEEVLALQALVREVHLGDDLLAWITRLVRASRPQRTARRPKCAQWVKWGAGPRAGQSLVLAAKARALLHGRLAATREDIVALAAPVMRHRLLLSFAAEAEQKSADDVVAALLRSVPFAGLSDAPRARDADHRRLHPAAGARAAEGPAPDRRAARSACRASACTTAAAAAPGWSSRSTAPTSPATNCARSTGNSTRARTASSCARPSAKARWPCGC